MTPIPGFSIDPLRFAQPAWICRTGWGAMAAAALSAASARLLSPELAYLKTPLLAGAVTLAILGILVLLRNEKLEIDLQAGTYRHTKGLWPLRRTQCGALDSFTRLALRAHTFLDVYGETVRRYTLTLEKNRTCLTLFRNWKEAPAMETAYRIAAQLGRPLEEAPAVRDRRVGLLTHGVLLWAGLAGAFVVMLWPVLSGSRPLWRTEERRGWRGSDPPHAGFSTFDRGIYLYYQGDYAGAEAQFRAALREFPRWADAYNMLAYALAEQGKLAEALVTAHRAHALAPGSGYITDTVAEMHERQGELYEAVKYYQQALRELPASESTETHAKYGRTLLSLGQRAQGIVHLKKAARNPGEPYGRRARRMLAELGVRMNPGP